MKIYFDGCAKTLGVAIKPHDHKRYATLLCNKLGAEEYNIARGGGSNRRLVRNLLEHDLSKYDLFVIQMSKRERFEWYNKIRGEWRNVCINNYGVPHIGLEKDYSSGKKEHFTYYYDNVYSDEMGIMDEKICFTAMKSLLQNKKHVIIFMGNHECSVPVDFSYIKGKNYHKKFDEKAHEKIYNDIIGHLS
tara:strand:+ start:348 stop:917 length:570 start_codon:yes stop_codon:yes gene_type:complete